MKRRSTRQLAVASKRERKIYDVTQGLKSIETIKTYQWHFSDFLKHSDVTPEQLITLEHGELEEFIVTYLQHLYNDRHRRPATINSAMAAIFHWADMNDLLLARKKISKLCIPAEEDDKEDRAYTRKEIGRLIKESDVRFRTIFLLLASTGMRIGAVNQLNIGDLTPISITDEKGNQHKIYRIVVYGRSKRGRYYTFCTPECADAIDEYLGYRKKNAKEDITQSTDSPLIREQFSLYNQPRSRSGRPKNIPRRVTQSAIEKSIERIVQKAGIDISNVALTHGFRKFAITQMKLAKVDFSDREYLVGHKVSRGRDVEYDRTTEEERLVEWSKAISNLTINDKYQLEIKLELIEGKQAQQMQELKEQIARMQQMIYKKDRRLMGFYDEELKPVAEGKKIEVSKKD
jgi:integrase